MFSKNGSGLQLWPANMHAPQTDYIHICYSYTTGTSALPKIYAQARGCVRILTGIAQVPAV